MQERRVALALVSASTCSPSAHNVRGARFRARWWQGQVKMAAGLLDPPLRRTVALWPEEIGGGQVELMPRWEAMAAAMKAASAAQEAARAGYSTEAAAL